MRPRPRTRTPETTKIAFMLVEKGAFQIGWSARNRKSLEPNHIAPTWIHLDVRQYAAKYLADEYFVTSSAELDSRLKADAAGGMV